MTDKQKRWTRVAVLLLLLVAAFVWKAQVYFSSWQGTVTHVVVPDQGTLGHVVLRDDAGREFRIQLPKEQLTSVKVGDRLAKPRMSLRVTIHEPSPAP